MGIKDRRRGALRVLGIFFALALLLGACGNSDDDEDDAGGTTDTEQPEGASTSVDAPGVTDTEIRFAAFGTQANNPLGTCVLDCYAQGIEAYFAYRNSEGGVHGREMKLTTKLDDELGKNKERALEIVAADDVFAAFSATQVATGWGDIAEAGIPLYTWSIHKEGMRPGIFGYTGAICFDCTSRTIPWLTQVAEVTKIASLGYGISENSKLCAQGVEKSLELYADDLEGSPEVVYLNDDLPFGLPNGVAPEVTAMKNAGVQFVSTCLDLNGNKTIAQEMARQGMGDVPIYHPNTYNQEFIADNADLFEGDYVTAGFRPFEADAGDSLLDEFQTWMEETGSDLSELAMYGWINAHTAYEGILAAGEDFSREKVIAATDAMEDFTAGGLVTAIDFGRQHDQPTQDDRVTHGFEKECVVVLQVADGELEVVGDAEAPWNCWSNESIDWSEPESTNWEQ
jgi:ABC-type branched-subunit amino acid transport system substrate-binding protein